MCPKGSLGPCAEAPRPRHTPEQHLSLVGPGLSMWALHMLCQCRGHAAAAATSASPACRSNPSTETARGAVGAARALPCCSPDCGTPSVCPPVCLSARVAHPIQSPPPVSPIPPAPLLSSSLSRPRKKDTSARPRRSRNGPRSRPPPPHHLHPVLARRHLVLLLLPPSPSPSCPMDRDVAQRAPDLAQSQQSCCPQPEEHRRGKKKEKKKILAVAAVVDAVESEGRARGRQPALATEGGRCDMTAAAAAAPPPHFPSHEEHGPLVADLSSSSLPCAANRARRGGVCARAYGGAPRVVCGGGGCGLGL
jgi:hypothetical protein